jgi:3-hydroxyisobutyrate dehydrogenase
MADRTPTVTLLGTGIMGAGMARNLFKAGLPVRVWNRTRAKAEPLRADGATVADTPADAAAGADVVVTMLSDADAVAAAMTGEQGAGARLADGAVWIQTSTVGVEGSERLGRLAADLGVSYVDAPVLGTKKPAEDGTLSILASGPEEARERCAPVFDAIGSHVQWLGPAGAGSRLKMVVNTWVLSLTEATAESVSLAEGLGLDPQLFLDTIGGGPTDSPYAHVKGTAMTERNFAPSFTTSGAAKDTALILAAARSAGVDLALVAAAHAHFAKAVDLGHGDEDMAATYYAHREPS